MKRTFRDSDGVRWDLDGAEIQIAGSEWRSYVTLMEVRHEYWNLDGGGMQI